MMAVGADGLGTEISGAPITGAIQMPSKALGAVGGLQNVSVFDFNWFVVEIIAHGGGSSL